MLVIPTGLIITGGAAAGGGGAGAGDSMVLLERQTIGTAAPGIELTQTNSSTYRHYRVIGWFGFAADFKDVLVLLGEAGSPDFLRSANRYLSLGIALIGDQFVSEGGKDQVIIGRSPADASGDANSNFLIFYDLWIIDPHDTNIPTGIIGESCGQDSSGRSQTLMASGLRQAAEDNDRIRFETHDGTNFDKADVALYGLK